MFNRLHPEILSEQAMSDDSVADLGNEEYFCNFIIISDLKNSKIVRYENN